MGCVTRIAVLLTLTLGSLRSQEVLSELDRDLFAFLDRFDPLDTSRLKFVRIPEHLVPQRSIELGPISDGEEEPGDQVPMSPPEEGFLLREDGNSAHIRTIDLHEFELEMLPAESPEGDRNRYVEYDLRLAAREHVERIRKGALDLFYLHPTKLMGARCEALLIAHACHRRGLIEEAASVLHALRMSCPSCDSPTVRLCDTPDSQSLLPWCTRILERVSTHRIKIAFGDARIPLQDLLGRVQTHNGFFPDRRASQDKVDLEEALSSLIQEEEVWKRRDPSMFADRLDLEAAEMVQSLRLAPRPWKGLAPAPDGWVIHPEIEAFEESKQEHPARDVMMAAVPRLLALADDPRPSRWVWYRSRYGGSIDIIPIGSLARDRIADCVPAPFEAIGSAPAMRRWWKEVGGDAWLAENRERRSRGLPELPFPEPR